MALTYKMKPCPYCGKRQKVTPWEREQHFKSRINPFPAHYCKECCRTSFINADSSLRKLTVKELKTFKAALVGSFKHWANMPCWKEGGGVLVFGSTEQP